MTTPDQQTREAIASGRAVLVSGAGFSAGVVDKSGQSLPVGRQLAQEIWPIGFGNQPVDSASSLGEIFRGCRAQNNKRLRENLGLLHG